MTPDATIFTIPYVAVTAKHMVTNVRRSPVELLPIVAVNAHNQSD